MRSAATGHWLQSFRARFVGLSRRSAAAALLVAALAVGSTAQAQRVKTETAIFAGGCFWCVEADFDKVPGVVTTISGYIGGHTPNPTYDQVADGDTGHAEAVRVEFDPARVSYATLVEYFWRIIDPLDPGGQFCDRGDAYRTAIFTEGQEQSRIAMESLKRLRDSGRFKADIKTEIVAATTFTTAEAEHQDFYRSRPLRYFSYRAGCGRDARVKKIWGDEAGGKSVLSQQVRSP